MNALADPDGRPVDLAAVQSDEALLNMLAVLGDADLERVLRDVDASALTRVLAAARRHVDTEPIPVLVGTDTAVAVIGSARKSSPMRLILGATAAVLAVLIVVFCTLGLMALYAHPGGLLWPLHQFLYPLDGSR